MSLRPLPVRRKMKKMDKSRILRLVLIALIVALAAVVGYILLREYQYGVSEDYYDSLRNLGLGKEAWLS